MGDLLSVPVVHAPVAPSRATSGNNQAQSKTATADDLEDQVYTAPGARENQVKLIQLFPRGFSIAWSEDPRYWKWHTLEEASDPRVEVVSLLDVCWLEIHGKLELSHLTPGVTYEVFFEAMLTEPAYGWSVPVNLRLKFPDGKVQERKEKLQEKPRGQWLELKVGEFKAQQGQKGDMEISMFEYDGGQWKRGLLIKEIKIIPKK